MLNSSQIIDTTLPLLCPPVRMKENICADQFPFGICGVILHLGYSVSHLFIFITWQLSAILLCHRRDFLPTGSSLAKNFFIFEQRALLKLSRQI